MEPYLTFPEAMGILRSGGHVRNDKWGDPDLRYIEMIDGKVKMKWGDHPYVHRYLLVNSDIMSDEWLIVD